MCFTFLCIFYIYKKCRHPSICYKLLDLEKNRLSVTSYQRLYFDIEDENTIPTLLINSQYSKISEIELSHKHSQSLTSLLLSDYKHTFEICRYFLKRLKMWLAFAWSLFLLISVQEQPRKVHLGYIIRNERNVYRGEIKKFPNFFANGSVKLNNTCCRSTNFHSITIFCNY